MGVLDFLQGGKAPEAKPVHLDADTSRLIDEAGQRAINYQPQEIKSEMGTFMPPDAKGPGNVAMSGALTNKYQRLANDDLEQMNRQQRYMGQQRRSQMLSQASHLAMARQKVANDNYARAIQAYNNQMAARAGVISSLLGLAGMAGGMALAGPAGAAPGAMMANAAAPKPQPASGQLGVNTQYQTDPSLNY